MFMANTDKSAIDELLTRGVEEVIEENHLREALNSGRKLRVKFGIDPTGSHLHLGHAVALRKLRQFQDLGHKAVLIIGDFTATIGDPTGRSETRKPLTDKEVEENLKKYLKYAEKILSKKHLEVRYNSEWHKKEGLASMLTLASSATIQQVLHRADFRARIDAGSDVTFLEILYPLFQGYDSVKVEADVELGGTDQKFNLLMGRRIQRFYKMAEQDIMTVPILEGTDGVKKMSKSFGNYIALDEEPNEMFGKVMASSDGIMFKFAELCTDMPMSELKELKKSLEILGANPRDTKARIAHWVVKTYHGEKAADKAEEEFNRVFRSKELPANVPEIKIAKKEISVIDLLIEAGLVSSKSEARRLIEQGGVKIDGMKVAEVSLVVPINSKGLLLQAGKRHFAKITSV